MNKFEKLFWKIIATLWALLLFPLLFAIIIVMESKEFFIRVGQKCLGNFKHAYFDACKFIVDRRFKD